MGWADDYYRRRLAELSGAAEPDDYYHRRLRELGITSSEGGRYVEDPSAAEAAPPWYLQAAERVLTPLNTALGPLRYAAAVPRAAVGRLEEMAQGLPSGTLGGGEGAYETFLGPAPAGRELLGLGKGTKGTFEWTDVPGQAVEMGLDPTMWLGFGGLSKAGKLAKEASELATGFKAATAAGKVEEAAAAAGKLAKLGLKAEEVPLFPLGRAAQAAAGLRRGWSLGVPFSDTARLALPAGPLSRSVLGAADVLTGGLQRGFNPLLKLISPSGRLTEAAFTPELRQTIREVTGVDPVQGTSQLIDLSRGELALAPRTAAEAVLPAAKNLARFATEQPEAGPAALRELDVATEPYRAKLSAYFNLKIPAAEEAGQTAKAAKLRSIYARELNSLVVPARAAGAPASNLLGSLTMERGGAVQKFDAQIAGLTKRYTDRITNRLAQTRAKEEQLRVIPSIAEQMRVGQFRVYRIDDVIPDATKPHGAYYSVEFPGFVSPHKVHYPTGSEFRGIAVPKRPLIVPHVARGLSRGVTFDALAVLVGADRLERLKKLGGINDSLLNMTRGSKKGHEKLLEYLETKYPSVSWKKYNDPQQMLEGLGGVLARQKGYDAVLQIQGQFTREVSEFVALAPNVVRPLSIDRESAALWTKTHALNAADQMRLEGRLVRLGARRGGGLAALANVPEPVQAGVTRLAAALGENLAGEQAAGVRIGELLDEGLGYMPHLVNESEAQKAAKMAANTPFGRVFKEYATTHRFALQRAPEWRGLPAAVINDLWHASGEAGDLFIEDPAVATFRRLMAGARPRASATLATGAVNLFAMPQELAGEGAIRVADIAKKLSLARVGGTPLPTLGDEAIAKALANTKYADAYVPKAIGDALLATHRLVSDPQALNGFWKFAGKVNGLYRAGLTIFFPAYEFRNEGWNVMAMYMAGLRNPAYLGRFAALQWRVRNRLLQEGGEVSRLGGRVASDAEMASMREIVQNAGLGRNLARDTADFLERQGATQIGVGDLAGGRAQELGALLGEAGPPAGSALGRAAQTIGQPIMAAGRAVARPFMRAQTAIEDNAKGALYLWAKDQGYTPVQAGQLVKKWLFDYGDLSRFEKDTVRQGVLYYTFQRKIWPLMYDELLTKPQRLSALGWATGEMGSRAEGRKQIPAWLQARAPIDLGTDEQGNRLYVTSGMGWENLGDFAPEGKGFGRSLGKLASNLAPLPLGLPLKLATDVDLRTGRNLRADPLVLAALNAAPPGVQKQLRGLEVTAAQLPTSRLTGTINDLLEGTVGRKAGLDTGLRLGLGLATTRLNPARNALRGRLDKIEAALINMERMSAGDTQRAKDLRTLRGRLRHQMRVEYPVQK